MNKNGKKILFLTLLIAGFISFFKVSHTFAAECDDISSDKEHIQEKIDCLSGKVSQLNAQANTLKNQISQFDYQIKLTTLKISQTQAQIDLLGGRIGQLQVSMEELDKAFSSRAVETYKLARFEDNFFFVLSAGDITEATSRFHYLKKIEEEDRNLLTRLENAQITYENQKQDQETLQEQLKNQQAQVNTQKAAKNNLLTATKNDEKKYQDLLSKALAEREAIQSIIAGQGKEVEVGKISEGNRIASVIPTSSACSSGGHLHFEVVKDGSHQSPANFLSSKGITWDNSPDGQFGFTGSWAWPINDPVRITQGYGMTYFAEKLRYYGGQPHTGIDMINTSDLTVKAVKPGTLFRGSINCGGGILKYVHVKQEDGYDTFYLHVNY
jgi:peptidoglycan hydrolase CwlO-like protein